MGAPAKLVSTENAILLDCFVEEFDWKLNPKRRRIVVIARKLHLTKIKI